MLPRDADWLVVSAVGHLPLVCRRAPQLVLGPFLERDHLPPHGGPHKGAVHQAEIGHQARVDDARMDRRGGDLRVAARDLGRVQDVGQLRLAISDPVADQWGFLRGAQVGEIDAVLGVTLESERGVGDDADVGAGPLGGLEHGREEQLDEQGMAEVVGPKLDFVAVRGQARRGAHDAGVAEQHVEAGRLRGDLLRCGRRRGEGSQVTFDEVDGRAAGDGGFDVFDYLGSGLLVAAGEIDTVRVVLGEL